MTQRIWFPGIPQIEALLARVLAAGVAQLRSFRVPRDGARAEIGAPSPHATRVIDGVTLAYNDEGQGTVVVCLHALGHGARDYARLRRRLRGHFRVIALDWPGHGRSSDDAQPGSVSRYTQLLAGFLDSLGIERAVLVGNSMGGGVAIRYTALNPERVSALVLANPAGLEPQDRLAAAAIGAMVKLFEAGAAGAEWFPLAFDAYYRLVLPGAAARAQRARIVATALEMAPLLARAWRSFADPAEDLRPLIPKIRVPVLFTWATRDRFIQLWRTRPAIRRFADARVATFAAGHSPQLETPDAFEQEVWMFLGDLENVSRFERSAG